MDESILGTIKTMLDVPIDQDSFDMELKAYINGALFTLCQIGVGPSTPFVLETGSETWSDFTSDIDRLALVKQYIFISVKLIFDTASTGSATVSALERERDRLEWRLNVEVDPEVNE